MSPPLASSEHAIVAEARRACPAVIITISSTVLARTKPLTTPTKGINASSSGLFSQMATPRFRIKQPSTPSPPTMVSRTSVWETNVPRRAPSRGRK